MSAVLHAAATVVFTAAGAALGTLIGGPIGGAIGASLGAFAAAEVNKATTPKPPQQAVNPMTWQSDPEAGIPYVMGRVYVGGQVSYRQAWASHNANETIITVASAGPIAAWEQLYVDGVATGYTNGGQADVADRGKMYVSVQFGAQPEARQLGDLGPPGWTTASKLSGLAASSVTLIYDSKGSVTFTTEPQVGWVVRGVSAYDPRLDSTYPGGSGPQRADNEATWTYSENPYLHALSFLIGRRHNSKLVIGVGMALSWLIVSQYVEGANVADANGWTIGATIKSTDNKWSRLTDILAAGGGEPLRLGAQIGCLVPMPRVSLATIDAGEVVGAASNKATQSRRDRLNAIVPRYMTEQSETLQVDGKLRTTVTWGMASAQPVVVADYVAFDGGQRQKQVDYEFVTKLNQAVQLARYAIEDSREFSPITLPLKLRWYGYRPGDVVTINHPQLGLNGQDVLILTRSLNPQSCTVTITARSETYAKHAFALGQTGIAPPTPSVTGAPILPVPQDGSWRIADTSIATGATPIAGLVITGAADSSVIDAIVIEYRPFVTGQADADGWVMAGTLAPSGTLAQISSVQPGTDYEAAVSYRCSFGIGARLVLGPVTTGAGATRNQARGDWLAGASYQIGDIVSFGGSTYECLVAHIASSGNEPPNTSFWGLWAAAGEDGTQGVTGATGPAGTDGKNGADAPQLLIQFSQDNASWHYGFQSGDLYIRMSADNGATWGDGAPFVGKGIRYAFQQADSQPAAPSTAGNKYPPDGWSPAPGSSGKWWATFAQFDSAGNITNGPTWADPFQATALDGASGATGATGPKGDKGDPGSASPSKVVGAYTATLTVQLTSGQSMPVSGSVYCANPTKGSTLYAEMQWSYSGTGSWNSFGSAGQSDQTSLAANEPGGVNPTATLTSTSGVTQIYDVRIYCTGAQGVSSSQSYIQAGG